MRNRRETSLPPRGHSRSQSESSVCELRLQMNETPPNPVTSQNRRTTSAISRLFYPPGWGNCTLYNGYEENLWKSKFVTWEYFEYYFLSIFLLAMIITVVIPDSKFLDFQGLSGWRWVVLGTVMLCGSLLSRAFIDLFVGMLTATNIFSPNTTHFAYATREILSRFLWFTAALFVTKFIIFDHEVKTTEDTEKIFGYVVKIFFCLIIATVIWLTKTLYWESRLISWYRAFHYPKLKLVLFSQFLLQSLLVRHPWSYLVDDENPELMCFEATIPEGKGTKKLREEVDVSQWMKMNYLNISALRLKTFVDIVRYGPCPTPNLDEQLNREIRDMPLSDHVTHLEMKARIVSDHILQNISMARGSNAELISRVDLQHFLPRELVRAAKVVIEKDQKREQWERITKSEVRAFRERRELESSLSDSDNVGKSLHAMLNMTVWVLIVVLWLHVFKYYDPMEFFLVLLAEMAAFVLSCGETVKTASQSLVFLFGIRTFDIGDEVKINGEAMVAESFTLLKTIFLKPDHTEFTCTNEELRTLLKDRKRDEEIAFMQEVI